jgi:CheY-like chemotaxis protein
VEVAVNGEQALYLLLQGWTPDVILMDLQMPVMDGISFLDILRSMERFRLLPVVVISALATSAMQDLAPYCVTAVLTKGYVDLQALAQSIDRLDQCRPAGRKFAIRPEPSLVNRGAPA